MDSTIPWYQSAIVRQQIAQVIVAATALLGVNLGGLDVDATLVNIFAGIAAIIAVYTTITRIFKPAPNLSITAVKKEIEMVNDHKIPPSPTGPVKQGGFFRPAILVFVAIFAGAISVVALPGCVGTTQAYKAADSLPDTAYVVTEHYAAIVKEAANLAESPGTPENVKDAMKKADAAVNPFIIGDDTHTSLQVLSTRYQEVRDAKTQVELQTAVNNAVRELAKLINAVKAARSPR